MVILKATESLAVGIVWRGFDFSSDTSPTSPGACTRVFRLVVELQSVLVSGVLIELHC